MASIVYTAKRSVQAAHSSGSSYTIALYFLQDTPNTQRIGPRPAVAIEGNQVTTLHRLDKTRDIVTDYVSASDSVTPADMVEFLDSVLGGELFTVDGVNYRLQSDSYSERGEGNIFKNYSFKIIQV